MNTLGIILTLFSALCHASWNLMGKSTNRAVQFSRLALMWSALCYFPLFVVLCFYAEFSWKFFGCVSFSGLLTGGYFYTLSLAYEKGEASVVYPLARSFPLLVLSAVVAFTDAPLNMQALAGILLIVAGGFLLPLEKFRFGTGGLHLKAYFNGAAFMAILAAIFTAGFSLVDKYAASVAISKELSTASIMTRVNYVYLQNLVSLILMEVIFHIRGTKREKVSKKFTIPAGLIFLVSYSLIIAAMATNPVAYVVSLRQLSIVIGAVVSMAMLEKRFFLPRVIAVIAIFAGVVLVGLA